MQPTFQYQATVLDIHDGDTVKLSIKLKRTTMKDRDFGFHFYAENKWITYHTAIRFNGINAPELSTPAGQIALAFLQTLIKVGDTVTVKTYRNPEDKYGRWLGDLWRSIDTVSLNQQMVDSGNAVVYHGEGPK